MAMLSAGAIQLAAVRVYSVLANRVGLRSLMMFGLACFPMGLVLYGLFNLMRNLVGAIALPRAGRSSTTGPTCISCALLSTMRSPLCARLHRCRHETPPGYR